jgi:hypothetical protein
MVNAETEFWRGYREEQRKRRAARLPKRTEALLALRAEGYEIEKKTEYHFRVNGRLDVWPTHNRYHDIRTGKRGGYPDIVRFIKRFFKN